ncbi:MAG: hypothetical protein ACO25B_03860 [Chitinophagaceae bacterium]
MKKIIRNSRFIALAFLTIFSAVSATATDSTRENPGVTTELKFAGMIKNDPVFELQVTGNSEEEDYIITINDRFGNRLYSETIRAEKFTKKFMLVAEEIGDEKLYFSVFCKKDNKATVYEISSVYRQISEMTVNRIQ